MHGKALRIEQVCGHHAHRLDSDRYQHVKACTEDGEIACHRLLETKSSSRPALSTQNKEPFLNTGVLLVDTSTKPSCCVGYTAAETCPMDFVISH